MRAPCWTCRSRTIQCDQSRTPCAKCEKAGLECLDKRPLRWVQGVAIRGKMRGRDPGKHDQVTDRQQPAQRKRNALCRTKSLTTNISPQFALQDPYVHHLDWSSRFYLDYYDLRISKLFILYDSERNPFRSLLTYALDDATLRMAILAVAARHFANSGHSFEQWNDALAHRFVNADWDALHFKMRAIKLLSSSLSCPGSSQKRTILLATILFMIFLDILESGIDGWQYHLHGAKSLVNLSRSLLEVGAKDNFSSCPDVVVEDTERFVGQQFALVSTIGGALSGSDDSTPDFFQFDENRHQESIIRSFLGCPGFLLRAIHFFSVQRHLVGSLQLHDDLTIYEHIRNTSTMLELTAKFNCHRRALESVQLRVPSEVQIEELTLLLQAFKIATMLYGNRILHAFKTHLGIITPDNHELVLQLLSTIDSLKSNATFFKCLLWPIFIVGLESQVASEHELVVEFLKRIWNLTCCVNVINASKILRDSWKHVHLGSSLAPGTAIPVIETGWLLV